MTCTHCACCARTTVSSASLPCRNTRRIDVHTIRTSPHICAVCERNGARKTGSSSAQQFNRQMRIDSPRFEIYSYWLWSTSAPSTTIHHRHDPIADACVSRSPMFHVAAVCKWLPEHTTHGNRMFESSANTRFRLRNRVRFDLKPSRSLKRRVRACASVECPSKAASNLICSRQSHVCAD